jgi:hypothetical protein
VVAAVYVLSCWTFPFTELDHLILNCDGKCVEPDDIMDETWLCADQCQSWSTPCNGKCPLYFNLNCANICGSKYHNITNYLCDNDCVTTETPCRGSCPNEKVLCNGKCQKRTWQCNGKCLDVDYKFANCDETCKTTLENWPCNSVCQPSEEPCNGKCPEGKCHYHKNLLLIKILI